MIKNKIKISIALFISFILGCLMIFSGAGATIIKGPGGDVFTAKLDGNMAEKPKHDPTRLRVVKDLSNAPTAGTKVGDVPSLKGIKFRASWYKNYFNTVDETKNSGQPGISAVYETDEDGTINFLRSKPVEGSWPTNERGWNIYPLGSIIIEEVSTVPGTKIAVGAALYHIQMENDLAKAKPVIGFSGKPVDTDLNLTPEEMRDAATITNDIYMGQMRVVKVDNDFNLSNPQGDATLEKTEYTVYNKSKNPVWFAEKQINPGEPVTKIYTTWDEQLKKQVASTPDRSLPYGTYEVKETTPPVGYLLNKEWSQTFSIREDNQTVLLTTADKWLENDVQRGTVEVGKTDAEINQYLNVGGSSSLAGAQFNIINRSLHPVYVQNKTFKPGEVVYSIVTQTQKDGRAIAKIPGQALPYGTYELKEVQAPKGYILDKEWSQTFQIREHGQVVKFTEVKDSKQNQVIRTNFEFTKKRKDNSENMGPIAFKMTDVVTGESHIIVTDKNGKFNSTFLDPTIDTNANDPTSPATNGAVKIVNGVWTVVDENKLDPDAGVWFTGTSPKVTKWTGDTTYEVNGIKAKPVDGDKSPFPFAKYRVEELRSSLNKGAELVGFDLYLDKRGMKPGQVYDHDTIVNNFVGIDTNAFNTINKKTYRMSPATGKVNITDNINLEMLTLNKNYTIKGEAVLFNEKGEKVKVLSTVEQKFKATSAAMHSDKKMSMTFKNLDLTGFEGHKVVIFQTLSDDKGIVFEHTDPNNAAQTIYIPKIGTTAIGDIDDEVNGSVKEITVTDRVAYKNLIPGKNYTMHGKLMNKKTGKPVLDADGKEITAVREFMPTGDPEGPAVSGTVDVVFKFKSTPEMLGSTMVAFEKVTHDNIEWATHADIEDQNQDVKIPKVKTTASDPVDGNNEVGATNNVTVKDTVKLSNLTPGREYTVNGTIHVADGKTGEDKGIIEGVNVEKTFTADKPDMTVELEATVDLTKYAGDSIVWFEQLSRNGVVLGIHADITDKGQTITVPDVGTRLATIAGGKDLQVKNVWTRDEKTGLFQVTGMEKETLTLVDKVAYSNVQPGQTYEVKGELHKRVEQDGKIVDGGVIATKTVTFMAKETNGFVNVDFKFSRESLKDTGVVAFETLVNKNTGQTVGWHEDITDENQTVRFVDIHTSFTDDKTKTHQPLNDETINLTDKVAYHNLIPGKQYEMCGSLMDKVLNQPVMVNKQPIKSCVKFTPTEKNGFVDIKFNVKRSQVEGRVLVAFEDLIREGKKIAIHADINDKEQTVYVAKIGTKLATISGQKSAKVGGKVELVDKVSFRGLIPGETYYLTGQLVNQQGRAIPNVDQQIVKFTPKESHGSLDVKFVVDSAQFAGSYNVVAFESLANSKKQIVAEHKDVNDKNQTVMFESKLPQTGLNLQTGLIGLALAMLSAGSVAVLRTGKRK